MVKKQAGVQISTESRKLTKDELADFDNTYHEILNLLVNDKELQDIPDFLAWVKKVMDYNVPHGKKIRGLMVPMTLKCLVDNPTDEQLKLSYVLGWCIEILQACFLVADDIMDKSETRRGKPCWYKLDDIGEIALNDSLLLMQFEYRLIDLYFKDKSYRSKVLSLFFDVSYKTIAGQNLDTQTGISRNMDEYTMARYSSIVKYKTCFYTTYIPIALALAMTGMDDPYLWNKVEEITLEIGHFFQVQDDYLDCFGDVNVTGKIGTDIQDCKCSWLFVVAKSKCTPQELAHLKSIYGIDDNKKIEEVKALYRKLGLQEEYAKYEEESYKRICKNINEISDKIPESVFHNVLNLIYKRNK